MAVDPSLLESLNRTKPAGSGEVARVRRSSRGKHGGENALSLLDSILDDSAAAAAEERKRLEEKQRRAEEEERLAKEREEEMARIEAEQAIIAEKQAQEDLKINQAKMQAQLQREKDIEAGIIDLEEEARQKREEEERIQAEIETKRRKTEAKLQAIELKKSQEQELLELQNEELAKAAEPKKSKAPAIIAAVVGFLIAGGVAAYFLMPKELPDPYALSESNDFYGLVLIENDTASSEMAFNIVKQAEDPKPEKKSTGGHKKPTTPQADTTSKPTGLTGGRGGIFGKKPGL